MFGFLMGAAGTMPGLSGGSVAFILGFYQRMIEAMAGLKPKRVAELIKNKNWSILARKLDLYFLLLLLAGKLVGIFLFSLFIPYLVKSYPAHMNALFLGLMIASVPHVLTTYERRPALFDWVLIVIATLITAYFCTLTSSLDINHPLFQFICGALAIIAMLLPGISGSFVLLLLGNYQFIFGNINRLFYFDLEAALGLMPFILGVILGLIIFVKVISFCFSNFRRPTLAILIGLMLGSLPSLWPLPNDDYPVILLLLTSGMAITFFSLRARTQ